jgi:D-glycero-D-manno-heptose 1,7-bisphosphate phosphatase
MRRAVFLDRDGVINQPIICAGKPYPPKQLDQLVIITGVKEAIASLKADGWMVIVVTNQPDVARGSITRADVEKINLFLLQELAIDQIRTCYHDDFDQCSCRKPAPGLLVQASIDLDIDLNRSYMVGDRWRDIEAGERAGCCTIYIDYDYSERKPSNVSYLAKNLTEAVNIIKNVSNESN